LDGEADVAWPGKIKFFALSSGTSESASKKIPVSKEMIKAMRITGIRHMLTLSNYNLPSELFEKGMLMLGGSTHLNYNGTYFSGDLSGITTGQIPFWFQHFYKPGNKISKNRNWDDKLNEITLKAKEWDIGFVLGVPAWIQIMMEKIIAHYKVNNIHDIWPNLTIYAHGGVSLEPYKKSFEKLLGKPLIYVETYLASEGFIAFQAKQGHDMKLMLNNGLFYEFVPFDDKNFDHDGEIVANPQTFMIDEIEEGKEYALLITTCAGAWRYVIGDVIKFTNKKECEIIIVGRTKHYLSLCGEHLSVDNMTKAIKHVSDELNIEIQEFTVAGIPYQSLFAHQWYIGTDDKVDAKTVKEKLDSNLKLLNDDYAVERDAALKDIFINILPTKAFHEYLQLKGKVGSQSKFPRVIKGQTLAEWQTLVSEKYSAHQAI
jgi:hypothetical protein